MTLSLRRLGATVVAALVASAASSADAQQMGYPGAGSRSAQTIVYGEPNGSYAPTYGIPNSAAGRPGVAPQSVYGQEPVLYPSSAVNRSAVYAPPAGACSGGAPCGGCETCSPCESCAPCNACDPCGVCEEDCDLRDEKVFLFFTKSEPCFDSFTYPVTNTTLWEDPRTLTGVRAIYIRQSLPTASVFGGGTFDVFALQARAALTERLSFIATKDGYIELNPTNGALGGSGFANVAAGLKYNLIRNIDWATLVSVGATYEIPMGSDDVFQGNGDGDFHFFMSGATELTEWSNWITGSGFRIPTNGNEGSQLWYWSNHFDVELVSNKIFFFGEFNWYHYMRSGNGPISGFEGQDLINLGADNVAGNDIVTAAIGPTARLLDGKIELSGAYEVPLTNRRDLLDGRMTFTAAINF